MIRTWKTYLGLLCCWIIMWKASAQDVYIYGSANNWKGKAVSVYAMDDYISRHESFMASDTVAEDGKFYLHFKVDQVREVSFKMEGYSGKIFVIPNFKYGITIPKADEDALNPNMTNTLDVHVWSDSTELNARVIDFNEQFNAWWEKHQEIFIRKRNFSALDSFQMNMQKRYMAVKDSFFLSYVDYTFADLNFSVGRHPRLLGQMYILNRPVLYLHSEYMRFFNSFYSKYIIEKCAGPKGNDILQLLTTEADLTKLKAIFKKDPFLQNDTICDLMLLKNMYELYFSKGYNQAILKSYIVELAGKTKTSENREIAMHILQITNGLREGSAAPFWEGRAMKGQLVDADDFKDRYVLLEFINPRNQKSLEETALLEKLQSKLKNKLYIVTILVDASLEEQQAFVKKFPRHDWTILRANSNELACLNYQVVKTPDYFVLNRNATLYLAHGVLPSEGLDIKVKKLFPGKEKD